MINHPNRGKTILGSDIDMAINALNGLADKWAENVDLPSMIKNATRQIDMEAAIDSIVRRAFVEGACRSITEIQPWRLRAPASKEERK